MSNMFNGLCVGGPHDGQMMAHWQKTRKYFRPYVEWNLRVVDAHIQPIEIGEYRLNDFGQWHWWATDAGRAMGVLDRWQTQI